MVFKNFYIAVVIRLLFIFSLMMLLSMVLLRSERLFTILFIGLVLAIAFTDLVVYITRANRDLSLFFDTIVKTGDITTISKKIRGANYKQLYGSFEKVATAIKNARLEKQAYYHFIEEVLAGIQTGVAIYNDNNERVYENAAANRHLAVMETDNKLNALMEISPGERKTFEIARKDKNVIYAVRNSSIKIKNQAYRIFNIQNIKDEMEEKETEAWQKLIRVMAHEIMNSVTPITSLSESSIDILLKNNQVKLPSEISEKDLQKIVQALHTIEQRGSGLHEFVNQYRKLAHIPSPRFSRMNGRLLADAVLNLMAEECNKQQVKLLIKLQHEETSFNGDEKMLEQVLINLVKNSLDALAETSGGTIKLSDEHPDENTYAFIVEDNGKGIKKEDLQKIFIPFFSSKPHGSGIGLAISRQIMQAHKGSLQVTSEPNAYTKFIMTFPMS